MSAPKTIWVSKHRQEFLAYEPQIKKNVSEYRLADPSEQSEVDRIRSRIEDHRKLYQFGSVGYMTVINILEIIDDELS